jgi:hypothetical protein
VGTLPKASWECHLKTAAFGQRRCLSGTEPAPARDTEYEFLFVLGQLRFKGGVQSMINVVAIRQIGLDKRRGFLLDATPIRLCLRGSAHVMRMACPPPFSR